MSLLQRLQEAETKVSGLERMLAERGREVDALAEVSLRTCCRQMSRTSEPSDQRSREHLRLG